MTKNHTLTSGPSRESLFDSLRLGQYVKRVRELHFTVPSTESDTKAKIYAIGVAVEGLHQVSKNEEIWFFWGRRTNVMDAPTFDLMNTMFAFGHWDTRHRTGQITFGPTSFFVNPLNAAYPLSSAPSLDLKDTLFDFWLSLDDIPCNSWVANRLGTELWKAKIYTDGDLCARREEEVRNLKYIGPDSFALLERYMACKGLTFKTVG